MPPLLRRCLHWPGWPTLFRPGADARLELHWNAPPTAPGGVLQVCVKLYAGEPLSVRRARLRLRLCETGYSRTVLDGYQEHARRQIAAVVELGGPLSVSPGQPLTLTAQLAWPEAPLPPAGERLLRREWRLEARVELANRRPLRAEARLAPAGGSGPAVDGRGFLPV